jgi:hypothetical protein
MQKVRLPPGTPGTPGTWAPRLARLAGSHVVH